jgi:hypothetical protein
LKKKLNHQLYKNKFTQTRLDIILFGMLSINVLSLDKIEIHIRQKKFHNQNLREKKTCKFQLSLSQNYNLRKMKKYT